MSKRLDPKSVCVEQETCGLPFSNNHLSQDRGGITTFGMDQPALPARARAPGEPPKRKILDWLSHPNYKDLSDFQQFVVDLDWTKSPLGPISTWTPQLHQMVLLVMSDPTPAAVYWGEENTSR